MQSNTRGKIITYHKAITSLSAVEIVQEVFFEVIQLNEHVEYYANQCSL
jgi:hypothetical protein